MPTLVRARDHAAGDFGGADTDRGRRRFLRLLAFAGGAAAAGSTLGVMAMALADRMGADPDDGAPLLYSEILRDTARGDAPRLVFLPGHGATTRYFRERVRPLATDAQLHLVDLLGFGHSPKPWVTYSVERHVTALRATLAGHGRVTLVGHSLGARLAIAYAARYPADVDALVLLALPYFGGGRDAYRYFSHGAWPGRWVSTRRPVTALACMTIRLVPMRMLMRAQPDLPVEVLADVRRHHWKSDVSTLWECLYRYDLPADVARLDPGLRVLCLHGDRDASAPLTGLYAFARRHRNTSILVLPGADHHPLLRDPAWCRAAIRTAGIVDGGLEAGSPRPLPRVTSRATAAAPRAAPRSART